MFLLLVHLPFLFFLLQPEAFLLPSLTCQQDQKPIEAKNK